MRQIEPLAYFQTNGKVVFEVIFGNRFQYQKTTIFIQLACDWLDWIP
jgi:hypothetical protein